MSGAGKSGTPALSQDSIGLSAPPRSDDPAWKYGFIDPKNKKHVVCMYCERVIKGGRITRLKEHLGGITGEIAACKNVPPEVKWQMERLVMETKKNKEKKRQLNEDIGNPYGNEDEELGEGSDDSDLEETTASPKRRKGQELQISFSSSQNRRKDIPPKASQPPKSNYFPPRTTPGSQPSIKSAMASKEMKDAADMTIARWWFDASIPFNAARSKFFQPMVNAIASIGAGYKAPSYHDFRGKLLKKSVEEVNRLMVHYKSSWSETGCSIMADGWTDGIQRSLINFLVYCPTGVLFLKSVDTSAIRKKADALFGLFNEVVLSVGPENVVQFITDNDATYKSAGKKLAAKYGTFYWTGCAAHCIDLILKDMARPDLFPKNAETIDTAKKVTKYIYNHAYVLNWMKRDFTNGRELVRPAITRFATNFISLQCLFKFRNELRQMWTSTAWVESSYASTTIAMDIGEILLSNQFWKNIEHILKVSESLVTVLRLVDSEDKPAMGYIYEAMDKAKEVIQKRLKKKSEYLPYWKVIDKRWDSQLHCPLHAAAYYLNPQVFFNPNADRNCREINKGLNDVIVRLVPDEDIQDLILKQCDAYKDCNYEFGASVAIRNRTKISPDRWWARFGNDTPELRKLAIRVLSQCCSASGCERNWSIFEHIHSPKRNRLEHQRLNDLVFVHYNLKLRERDMIKRTGKNALDPISLENIDILADWIAEEPTLMTIDEVEGWATIEVGSVEEDIPDFDGGEQVTVAVVEEEDDDDYDDL